MAKLKLQPDPVFKATAKIHAAGAVLDLEFTFKHRSRDQLAEFGKSSTEMSQEDQILEMAAGWELADEFNKENVAVLLQNYTAAFVDIWNTYLDELARYRVKN